MIYNGTIHPDISVTIHDSNGPIYDTDGEMLSPYINEAGQFSVSLETGEIEAGEEIGFRLSIARPGEEIAESRYVQVLPAEEGMEIVESSADTSDVQTAVLEATSYDWQEDEAIHLEVETVRDVQAEPYYAVNDNPITVENRLENLEGNVYSISFTPDSLKIGDVMTIYVIASGVTTPVEVEVPDSLTLLQDASEEEPVESEDPDNDEESEDQEDNVDEVAPPEIEGLEDEGMSTGWIIAGVVLGLSIIGGIIFAMMRRNQ